jgi:hypothetical protein
LEHSALLLEGIIVAFTAAEAVLEVVIVFVVRIRFFGVNVTLKIRRRIGSQSAWARRWDSLRATVASEVTLLKDLNQGVLAVALNGAGIADTGRCPRVGGGCGRRIAGQTSEDVLSQGTENIRAAIDALKFGSV